MPDKPIKLLPWDQVRELAREHVETVGFIDPDTGAEYRPSEPPVVNDPAGDEDSDVGED